MSLAENKELERYKSARSIEAAYLKDRSSLAITALANARDGAKHLVTAAAAIATIYTAALGLVFQAQDNPLPERAVWSILFLGLSVILAAWYLAPVRRFAPALALNERGGQSLPTLARLSNNITAISNEMSTYNRTLVMMAVAALAFGVGAMAFPFVEFGTETSSSPKATAPPLPEIELTGDAARAYSYQVILYERALCSDPATSDIVENGRCASATTVPSGLRRAAPSAQQPSVSEGPTLFSTDAWARLYALVGLGAIGGTYASGRHRDKSAMVRLPGSVAVPLDHGADTLTEDPDLRSSVEPRREEEAAGSGRITVFRSKAGTYRALVRLGDDTDPAYGYQGETKADVMFIVEALLRDNPGMTLDDRTAPDD